jgi:hypothetical protein
VGRNVHASGGDDVRQMNRCGSTRESLLHYFLLPEVYDFVFGRLPPPIKTWSNCIARDAETVANEDWSGGWKYLADLFKVAAVVLDDDAKLGDAIFYAPSEIRMGR